MNVTHKLTADLLFKGVAELVHAVQCDANTRAVAVTLTAGGVAWEPPAGTSISVAFKKPDGKKGWYDKLPDKSPACSVSGNTVTAILAPEVLTAAGKVDAVIVFQDKNLNQLATFGFSILVEPNPAAGRGISNDYYAYSTMEAVSEAVDAMLDSLEDTKADIGQLIVQVNEAVSRAEQAAGPAIVNQASGDVIAVSDSTDRTVQGLKIFGKTVQNGTPSPNAPVPLESAGTGGSVGVTVAGKNLLNNQAATTTINGITFTVNADKSITVNGTATAQTSLKLHTGNFLTVADFAGCILSGCPSGADKNKYCILVGYYNSNGNWQAETHDTGSGVTLAGTHKFLQISILVRSGISVSNVTFYPMVRDSDFADATYEPYKSAQILSVSTPNGLPGIPVASGGNYTDSNGKQWICDEIDLARGVYVQRIAAADFSQGSWLCSPELKGNGSYRMAYWQNSNPQFALAREDVNASCLCSHFPWSNRPLYANDVNNVVVAYSNAIVFRCDEFNGDGTAFTAWLKENAVKVQYVLATNTETPLDADTLAAYAALHTNKSNTTVLNDAGAGLRLGYVADTKLYIDQKFTELENAILSAGANV